jgi:transposase-like protein
MTKLKNKEVLCLACGSTNVIGQKRTSYVVRDSSGVVINRIQGWKCRRCAQKFTDMDLFWKSTQSLTMTTRIENNDN